MLTAAENTSGVLPEEIDVDLSFAWESHYVPEGRDMLNGDGLLCTTLEASIDGLVLGSWYAGSDAASPYTEWNGYAIYGVAWHGFEAYAGYMHLEFITDDARDDEVGAGLAYVELPCNLRTGVDGYHSFEADGAFFEISIGGDYPVGENLALRPTSCAGFNAGYIADGHTGANHTAVTLEAVLMLRDGVELSVHVAQTWGIDADPARYAGDELLDDFFHGGVELALSL
jgi:hypothetical protein